jgi:hypothetical protein
MVVAAPMRRRVDGSNDELIIIMMPLSATDGDVCGGVGLLSSWWATTSATTAATAGGFAIAVLTVR